jgi:hypothetical protein
VDWFLSGIEAEDHYHDAQHRDLLVCAPILELLHGIALLNRSRSSYEMAKAYFKRQRQAATDGYGAKVT